MTTESSFRFRVVLDQSNTRQLIRKMRDRIERDHAGKDVTYVRVMQGAGVFAANLELGVKLPRSVESVHAYAHVNADGVGDVDVRFVREEAIRDRHLIVVDDMLISGETLHLLSEKLLPMGPASIEHAVLVVKRGECRFPGISPRYAGIEVNPKAHIVGMGMDWAGKFRSLPHLAQIFRVGVDVDQVAPEVRVLLPGFELRRPAMRRESTPQHGTSTLPRVDEECMAGSQTQADRALSLASSRAAAFPHTAEASTIRNRASDRLPAAELPYAIAHLDAADTRALLAFSAALSRAKDAKDADGVAYFSEAISDLLCPSSPEDDVDLSAQVARLRETPEGNRAEQSVRAEEATFFDRYHSLKAESGLNTYRKIAEAAGISVTTVQAIEKQRIKPQFRTIEKLAKAFGVPVAELGRG